MHCEYASDTGTVCSQVVRGYVAPWPWAAASATGRRGLPCEKCGRPMLAFVLRDCFRQGCPRYRKSTDRKLTPHKRLAQHRSCMRRCITMVENGRRLAVRNTHSSGVTPPGPVSDESAVCSHTSSHKCVTSCPVPFLCVSFTAGPKFSSTLVSRHGTVADCPCSACASCKAIRK